ncbi:MAG TPA: gephyrin-like molybdotransferase Glp [Vicinamibacterales bacterium]
MRPFSSTISIGEARRRLRDGVRPISKIERIPLERAAERVAAADVTSTIDVPPFTRSAMDGYAVAAADTALASPHAPAQLELVGRVFTGEVGLQAAGDGRCVEIATGAPLPPGADAVVMVEDTRRSGGAIQILNAVTTGQNVGRRGADITCGDRIVAAGDVLVPSRIGALAATGIADVDVFARPRVAILSTGNEVVDPGQPLPPGHIFDVNRFTLGAVVSQHGCDPDLHRPVADTLDALVDALDRSSTADVIVFSGGSSVGERDLILDAVRSRGEMVFHGIAVRPGKPTAFAIVNDRPFFGMPGNPTSCLSNAYVLLVPFLRSTARLPPHQPRLARVPLGRRITSPAGRHQFYTVRIRDGVALPAFKGSGDITSLSQADGYIEIPETQSVVEEGAVVEVTLF